MTSTFEHEATLPRVPLPTLEETSSRFLDWCAPLLNERQLKQTREAVEDFRGGPGPVLQEALRAYDRDASNDGWLDEFWRDRYLGRRDPIAVNANFYFRLTRAVAPRTTQLGRAAELLSRAVDLRLRIDREQVPADPGPASMQQLRHLFCTTRVPGERRDSVRTQYSPDHPGPSPSRHVAVFYRGHIFVLDVLDEGGEPLAQQSLHDALGALTQSVQADAAHPIGALSTGPRAGWAEDRARLIATDPSNLAALDIIESAMCGLALEHEQPADADEMDHSLLCGSGRDRWFDLATTFIVFPDATAGLNSEHCLLDGTTILRLIDDLAADRDRPAGAARAASWSPVEFVLDDEMRRRVERALREFTLLGEHTALLHVSVDGLSRDGAKSLGCSPDAFFQVALQLAQVRSRGQVGATYESVATRGWRNGRTEAMRVVTPELVALTDVMGDPASGDADRLAAFDAAAAAHVARARECQRGEGPEQHLWELDRIRERSGARLGVTEQPELFTSPGWIVMRDDRLSTSAAVTPNVASWGFGATTAECIGVAYALLPDSGFVTLSTPAPVAGQMTRLADELQRAVGELNALLRSR